MCPPALLGKQFQLNHSLKHLLFSPQPSLASPGALPVLRHYSNSSPSLRLLHTHLEPSGFNLLHCFAFQCFSSREIYLIFRYSYVIYFSYHICLTLLCLGSKRIHKSMNLEYLTQESSYPGYTHFTPPRLTSSSPLICCQESRDEGLMGSGVLIPSC